MDLTIVPGTSLGPFVLKSSISTVIEQLQRMYDVIPSVKVHYEPDNCYCAPIVLVAPSHGLHFHFDPFSQALESIAIHDMSHVTLRYRNEVLCQPGDVSATYGRLTSMFTLHETLDKDAGSLVLRFPGLVCRFPAPEEEMQAIVEGGFLPSLLVTSLTVLPKSIDDVGSKESRHIGSEKEESGAEYRTIVGQNVFLHSHPLDFVAFPGRGLWLVAQEALLAIHCHLQTVLTLLGPPSAVYYKENDEDNVDYFYNYFSLGLDCLIDGSSHSLQKIILHTNVPQSWDFHTYMPARFAVAPSECLASSTREVESVATADASSAFHEVAAQDEDEDENHGNGAGGYASMMGLREISLTEENPVDLLCYWQQLSGSALQDGTAGAFSSWLGPSAKPLEHHPSTAEDSMAASSRFYCHAGLVIELLSSGIMASVTVTGTAATEQ